MMGSYTRLNLKPHRKYQWFGENIKRAKMIEWVILKASFYNCWWSTQLFKQLNVPEAPNENVVVNHLNIALLNVF